MEAGWLQRIKLRAKTTKLSSALQKLRRCRRPEPVRVGVLTTQENQGQLDQSRRRRRDDQDLQNKRHQIQSQKTGLGNTHASSQNRDRRLRRRLG